MVTFGDLMSLLLTFFVLLLSLSEIKSEKKFQDVMQSIRAAFGYVGGIGAVPTTVPPKQSMVKRLQDIVIPKEPRKIGDSEDEGIEAKNFRVRNVRDGQQIIIGGPITFVRFSAELQPEAEAMIARLAEEVRGLNTMIEVRGHTTNEPLPDDSPFANRMELALARAKAVYDVLIKSGVRKRRLTVTGAADHEPLKKQAYTERRRAENRRVEIIVKESLMNDYEGEALSREEAIPHGE